MLMDEPFGAVDPIVRERLQNEFLRLQEQLAKTILFVTHDIDEAIKLGDVVAVFRDGGIVEQFATPAEILAAPASEFVARFVGADRGLKRLSLTRVNDVELGAAPTARIGEDAAGARDRTRRAELPYLLLLDAVDRPVGWIEESHLPASGPLCWSTGSVGSCSDAGSPTSSMRPARTTVAARSSSAFHPEVTMTSARSRSGPLCAAAPTTSSTSAPMFPSSHGRPQCEPRGPRSPSLEQSARRTSSRHGASSRRFAASTVRRPSPSAGPTPARRRPGWLRPSFPAAWTTRSKPSATLRVAIGDPDRARSQPAAARGGGIGAR